MKSRLRRGGSGASSAPEPTTAHLLVDMVNPLSFDGAEALVEPAVAAAREIAALKAVLRGERIPTVYVNDNFGRWELGFRELAAKLQASDCLGRPLIDLLPPQPGDHFVLKPKHSGFYNTSLEILLDYLRAERLVVTGVAANICVFFTANDAYMRGYEVLVPSDCVASERARDTEAALEQMHRVLKADVRPWRQMFPGASAGNLAASVRASLPFTHESQPPGQEVS